MYVRWKVLIGLGTAFWLLLCLLDYLPIKHIDHIVLHKNNAKVQQEVLAIPQPPKKEEDNPNIIKVLFWNLVAFASTITVCFALKSISSKLNIINNQSLLLGLHDKSTVRKNSSSKIPIPIMSKSSSIDIHIDGAGINSEAIRETDYNKSCPNLLGLQDFEEKSKPENKVDRRIWSIRNMEKHCAKLREEMINLQGAAIKEQSTVAKKIETLTKEKKELMKQFNVLTKENKSLKQQIEEMIQERTLLIRRLECATKEMKNATKNKRTIVAKLDEAVANAEILKTNLEQIKRDKNILEDRLIILDAEYRRLKGEVELHKQKDKGMEKKLLHEKKMEELIKENTLVKEKFEEVKDKNVLTQTEESDYDVSKSEQDMLKVQQKLRTLEKSLETFKIRSESRESTEDVYLQKDNLESEVSKSDGAETPTMCLFSEGNSILTIGERPSTNSLCTEPDCPLEHKECLKAECFLKQQKDELLKEGPSINSICIDSDCPLEHKECMNAECFLRRRIEDTDISSSGEDSKHINYQEYMALKKRLPKVKSCISDDRLSVISELATSTGDESGDDWTEPKRRFVTHSPAFQKFYRETLEAHKNYISKNTIDSVSK